MKKTVAKLAITAAVIAQFFSAPCLAAIPRQIDYGIDFSKIIQPIESYRTIKASDIAMVIPYNMAPSDSGSRVATQILDYSLQNFFKRDEIRNSDLGRSAQRMENAMESNVSFGGEDEGATKHVIKFQMKPVQTRAQIEYSGFVKAQVSYQIASSQFNVEVSEKVALDTDLVITHNDNGTDRRDMVSFRFSF